MDTDDYRISGDEQDDQDDQEDVDSEKIEIKEIEDSDVGDHPENRAGGSRETPTRSSSSAKTRSAENLQIQNSDDHVEKEPVWIKKNAKCANAFINFVQDYKKENPQTMTGRNIFRECGEKWKNMTDEEKQPYIAAANTVKKLKQQKLNINPEQHAKKCVSRVHKRKAETKRKETFRKRSKVLVRDVLSNSDTETAATVHSSLSDADSF